MALILEQQCDVFLDQLHSVIGVFAFHNLLYQEYHSQFTNLYRHNFYCNSEMYDYLPTDVGRLKQTIQGEANFVFIQRTVDTIEMAKW